MTWADTKFDMCRRDDKPDRVHPTNWRLSERWVTMDKGRDKAAETCLEETLNRDSTDVNSSMSALGLPEQQQGSKKKSAAELHKSSLTKATQMASRMAKCLMTCESSLPSMRRSVSGPAYLRLKEGLHACRVARDQGLDDIEDLKVLPDGPDEQEKVIAELNKVTKSLQEHNQALVEAFGAKKKEECEIKKDQDETDHDAASSAGTSGNLRVNKTKHTYVKRVGEVVFWGGKIGPIKC